MSAVRRPRPNRRFAPLPVLTALAVAGPLGLGSPVALARPPRLPALETAPEPGGDELPLGAADEGESVFVHVVETRPDDTKGPLKLVRHIDTSAAHGTNVTIVTNRYEELCRGKCRASVDVSERPILYFMRDGAQVSGQFRLPRGSSVVTLKYQSQRKGLLIPGMLLTYLLILPVGIPLWIAGSSRVRIANGEPSANQTFVRAPKP